MGIEHIAGAASSSRDIADTIVGSSAVGSSAVDSSAADGTAADSITDNAYVSGIQGILKEEHEQDVRFIGVATVAGKCYDCMGSGRNRYDAIVRAVGHVTGIEASLHSWQFEGTYERSPPAPKGANSPAAVDYSGSGAVYVMVDDAIYCGTAQGTTEPDIVMDAIAAAFNAAKAARQGDSR